MKKITSFTLGADIEAFVKFGGRYRNAEKFIQGTKHEPEDLVPSTGFKISHDNILAEYTIPPVGFEDFNDELHVAQKLFTFFVGIIKGRDLTSNYLQVKGFGEGALHHVDAIKATSDILDTPNSLILGCEPDFCVHTEDIIEKPTGEETDMRSSGFHIHLSFPEFNPAEAESITTMENLIRLFDIYVTGRTIMLDTLHSPYPHMELHNINRRELYGQAGAFRIKEYTSGVFGFEYRTLGGSFIEDFYKIYLACMGILEAIAVHNSGTVISKEEGAKLGEFINSGDAKGVRDYLSDTYGVTLYRNNPTLASYSIKMKGSKEFESFPIVFGNLYRRPMSKNPTPATLLNVLNNNALSVLREEEKHLLSTFSLTGKDFQTLNTEYVTGLKNSSIVGESGLVNTEEDEVSANNTSARELMDSIVDQLSRTGTLSGFLTATQVGSSWTSYSTPVTINNEQTKEDEF